ncbi:MAG: PAS domain-containing sensor histidine kinase [Gammaproteobacteria bacterium]|nr:PAS domain-containing sensor histidine kinase [Gammaproteobacteria bacterium]
MAATNTEILRQSFDLFNRQSCLLDASYAELQDKVDLLTQELKLSQLARHREFVEKERLGIRMTCALDAVPGAVLVLDGGGIIREKNTQASELLNQPLLGCAWSEIAKREFSPAGAADGDLRLRDGRWFNLSRQPFGSEPGELLLLADVTESRRMAELLQRRERLSSMGEMTATLAHQIRTPLTSALLYVGQFGKGTQDETVLAGKVSDRLLELVRMVDDMLCYAGGARRSGESFSVDELFQEILDSVKPCMDSGVFSVATLRKALTVEGNRDAIRGALINLIDNAQQACGDTGRVELGAEEVNDSICLTVSDNGHGIAADIKERLFEPFFTTRPQGTGLGLAVVRAVADAHDGEILIDSGAHGSTFALCLPSKGEQV